MPEFIRHLELNFAAEKPHVTYQLAEA